MSQPAARADLACRNCGAPAPLAFCGHCGQETALHAPTLAEFAHEFVGHYVALEGALWRTLGLLLLHPGRLTREYLAGRRRRYVLPLRLYLTASFLFFLVLKLLPSAIDQTSLLETAARPGVTVAELRAAASAAEAKAAAHGKRMTPVVMEPVDCGGAGQRVCGPLERMLRKVGERYRGDPRGFSEGISAHLMGAAPYAVFLLLPVFAAFMMLAYRNRRMTYGEHVVFSLHLQAFWFLALLPITLLPESAGDVVQLAVPVYGVWAMHTVYGGGWIKTMLRALFVSVVYGIVLLLLTAGLVVAFLAMG